MIDVVTNSAQATPTRSALNFSWGEPWFYHKHPNMYMQECIQYYNHCDGGSTCIGNIG